MPRCPEIKVRLLTSAATRFGRLNAERIVQVVPVLACTAKENKGVSARGEKREPCPAGPLQRRTSPEKINRFS